MNTTAGDRQTKFQYPVLDIEIASDLVKAGQLNFLSIALPS